MGSHRVGHDWSNLAAAAAADRQTTEEQRCFRNERREGHSGNQAEDIEKSRGKVAVRSVLKSTPGSVIVTQSCCALRDPMDCSPPGSSVCGIFQARILEWVAMPFPRGSSQSKDQTWISCIEGGFFTVWATREDNILTVIIWFYYSYCSKIKIDFKTDWKLLPRNSVIRNF